MNIFKVTKVILIFFIFAGCEGRLGFMELSDIDSQKEVSSTKIPPNIQLHGVISQTTASSTSNITNFEGHSAQVTDLAFSSDGQLIATASYDKTVRLWDTNSPSPPRVLLGHSKGVNKVAISPDGDFVASGSWDSDVILWEVASGKQVKRFSRHRKGVSSLAFTPDGNVLLSGDYGGTLNVWDLKDGIWLGSLAGHNLAIQEIVISPDGLTAASAGADRNIHLWDIETLTEVKRLKAHSGIVKALTFTPNGDFLLSGGSDDKVIMWSTVDGAQVRIIGDNLRSVNSLSVSPDGQRLLIADTKVIHLWDLELEEKVTSLYQHKGIISSAKFSPVNNLVGSASHDGTTKLWEAPFGIVTSKEGQVITKNSVIDIAGSVLDKDLLSSVNLNGEPLAISADGSFNVSKNLLIGQNKFELVAIDEIGNKSEYTLLIERQSKKLLGVSYSDIKRPTLSGSINQDRVAIIIGIDKYDNIPSAQYAENDARLFYDFAINTLAVSPDKIRLLYGKDATRAGILKTFSNWLKSYEGNPDTEVFVFYSGHGMSKPDGSDAYFIPVDGDPALLEDTGISRKRLLDDLESINAKSVSLFLDTCYSGLTRSGEAIVASLRPIIISATNWKGLGPGISVLSAASNNEISISLGEKKHGLFSYFLMRALSGEADKSPYGNDDGQISLTEILNFVEPQVSRTANTRGQKQTPQLLGAPKTIIANW